MPAGSSPRQAELLSSWVSPGARGSCQRLCPCGCGHAPVNPMREGPLLLSFQGTAGPDPTTVYVDMRALRHDR